MVVNNDVYRHCPGQEFPGPVGQVLQPFWGIKIIVAGAAFLPEFEI
jgi:hypothetical protein